MTISTSLGCTCYWINGKLRNEIKFQFNVVFETILNLDKELSSEELWVLRCMWRTVQGRQLGIGLGMEEMRSVGVLQCVSEWRVTVYCAPFIESV